MKYKIVIFDFDGTIADSFSSFLIILNKLAQEMDFRTVAPEEIEAFRSKKSQDVIQSLNISFLQLPFVIQQIRKEFRHIILEIPVIPNMQEILLKLQAQGILLGLLSSNGQENIQDFLRNNGLDCFDVMSSSAGLWSKTRCLNKIIRDLNVAKKEVLYVGDETRDIEAAYKAGVQIAAVTWGYNNAEALRAFSPDYLLESPQELLSIATGCR